MQNEMKPEDFRTYEPSAYDKRRAQTAWVIAGVVVFALVLGVMMMDRANPPTDLANIAPAAGESYPAPIIETPPYGPQPMESMPPMPETPPSKGADYR